MYLVKNSLGWKIIYSIKEQEVFYLRVLPIMLNEGKMS